MNISVYVHMLGIPGYRFSGGISAGIWLIKRKPRISTFCISSSPEIPGEFFFFQAFRALLSLSDGYFSGHLAVFRSEMVKREK